MVQPLAVLGLHGLGIGLGGLGLGVGVLHLLGPLGQNILDRLKEKMLYAGHEDQQVADGEDGRPRGEGDQTLKLFHIVSSLWMPGLPGHSPVSSYSMPSI